MIQLSKNERRHRRRNATRTRTIRRPNSEPCWAESDTTKIEISLTTKTATNTGRPRQLMRDISVKSKLDHSLSAKTNRSPIISRRRSKKVGVVDSRSIATSILYSLRIRRPILRKDKTSRINDRVPTTFPYAPSKKLTSTKDWTASEVGRNREWTIEKFSSTRWNRYYIFLI